MNYAHLCYVYIRQYKGIKDIEIIIDPRYNCSFNKEESSLSIIHSDRIPEKFWGMGIHSVAVIVGDNGVGKSSTIEFILKAIVEGANENVIDGILVYERGGSILVYGKDLKTIPSNVQRLKSPEKICCLYYCGHFQPYESIHNLRSSELAGSYNISDGYLLIKDVQSYSNTDSHFLNQSIASHLNQYQAKNNYRICMMLSNERLNNVISPYFQPRFIIITENKSGAFGLNNNPFLSRSDSKIPRPKQTHRVLKQRVLANHIYNNFLNQAYQLGTLHNNEYIDVLQNWLSFMNDDSPVLNQFEEFTKTKELDLELRERLLSIDYALKQLDELADFKDNIVNGFYYLNVSQDYEKVKELCSILERSGYLVAQLYDISYAQSLSTETILSSGEQKLMDLFSRLYFAIQKDAEKFSNLDAPALLILDEAEIAFHPEWQRKYISLVISFLHEMLVQAGVKFQILISTHSPILLSDIPKNCITFLQKDANGVARNVHPDDEGTFAANVFEQYRNSFFMSNGLIGAFAQKKIREIEDDIENRNDVKNLPGRIKMIGDEQIRNYLTMKLAEIDRSLAVALLEEQIQQIKNGSPWN